MAKKYVTPKIRPLVKTHGGKQYLCRRIVYLFPWHSTYVEPFLGGGSVLMNKTPSTVEVAADLNPYLINMWNELKLCNNRDRPDPWMPKTLDGMHLDRMLVNTPYSLDTFLDSNRNLDILPPTTAAWAFVCRNRMSRGGHGKAFAWSERLRGKRSEGGPVPGELNSWATFLANDLPRGVDRTRDVTFLCQDWKETVEQYKNKPHTLIYLDPPYYPTTRTARKAYGRFEMTPDDHEELVEVLRGCKATWFLSGYECPLYAARLGKFPKVVWEMPNHSGQGKSKQRRREHLWTNYSSVIFEQPELAGLREPGDAEGG